jgi:hypothetical protein
MATGIILGIMGLLVMIGRTAVPGHELSAAGTYEAFAHIWVGAAIMFGILKWHKVEGKAVLIIMTLATIQETFMFLNRSK